MAGLKERLWPTTKGDNRKAKYQSVEAELNEMVEIGRLTREQADERLLGFRQKLWGDRDSDRKKFEMEAVNLKIKAAVQAGDLTPEEGREKMRAIRENIDREE